MEFPNIGGNCAESTCNKLDFLPVKCDGCLQLFCGQHMTYSSHGCLSPKRVDNQVPVCPLCNMPVPSKRGQQPDIPVNAHIERDCQSDPALKRRKTFIRCSYKACKNKEVIPIVCEKCSSSFCVYHRHPADHKCDVKSKTQTTGSNASFENYTSRNDDYTKIQGYMTEDEALAYAIAISSMPNSSDNNDFRTNRSSTANNCNVS